MSVPHPGASAQQRWLLAITAAAVVVLLVLLGVTRRADVAWYDAISASAAQQPDPRVVVIAIDDASVAALGRWPWSRRVHAQMIDRLRQAGVRGVALDVLLSEPMLYDPEGDALLARALARSGKVVLPVRAETAQSDDGSVELMPIPEFAAAAAALGHVDAPRDADGVVRSHFLRAGLGSPQWPSLALALYQLDRDRASPVLPGLQQPTPAAADAHGWLRDHQVLVPFASPENTFNTLAYADVLSGKAPAASLQGRWVLIGVTTEGLEAGLAVPGRDAAMSRLEYQANAFSMLLGNQAITPMSMPAQLLLSMALAALPLLLYALPAMRPLWRPVVATMALALLLSWGLLHGGRLWFAPFAPLLVLAVGGLIAGYGLMRRMQRRAQLDPLTGLTNRSRFDTMLEHELNAAQHSGQPLSLLVLDVDRFRQFDDRGDSEQGQRVLRALAQILRCRARRPRDVVARLGGDQFAVLLPETSSQAAATIATTLHVDLANLAARPAAADTPPPFSTSIGLHTWTADAATLSAGELFGLAEAALYRAKQSGRHRAGGHAATDVI